MQQDLQAIINPVMALTSGSYTSSQNGLTIDTAGYSGITFEGRAATTTTADADNRFDFKIQHGNASDNSDMADVPATDMTGAMVIDAAADDNKNIGKLSYVPMTVARKRYVRIVATAVGTVSSVFGVGAILHGSRKNPIAVNA